MAQITIKHTFVNGTKAMATEVDENFQQLVDAWNGGVEADNIKDGVITKPKLAFTIASDKYQSVATFSDLSALSPNDGDTYIVVDEHAQYMYDATNRVWSKISGTVATVSHNSLTGRDANDSHPISAITGLQYALDTKQKNIAIGTTAPSNPQIDDLWINNSSLPYKLYRYSGVDWGRVGSLAAKDHTIADANNHFNATNVEDALDELYTNKLAIGDYGVGGHSINISGTDLNTLTKSGWYSGYNLSDDPADASYVIVQHIEYYDGTSKVQFLYKVTGDFKRYARTCNNGTWSAWKEFRTNTNRCRLHASDATKLFRSSGTSPTFDDWMTAYYDTFDLNNSGFTVSNGLITIPETGNYRITARIRCSYIDNAAKMAVYKNGTFLRMFDERHQMVSGSSYLLWGTTDFEATANDTIEVRTCYLSSTAPNVNSGVDSTDLEITQI